MRLPTDEQTRTEYSHAGLPSCQESEEWHWGLSLVLELRLAWSFCGCFLNERSGISRNKGLEKEKEGEEWI